MRFFFFLRVLLLRRQRSPLNCPSLNRRNPQFRDSSDVVSEDLVELLSFVVADSNYESKRTG